MYDLQNKVVMVVGGAGFIGSALVREFLNYRLRVISYDNYFHGSQDNLQELKEWVSVPDADVFKREHLIQTIREYNVDYIINCMGDPFIPSADQNPQRVLDINIEGTRALLEAIAICQVKRMLHISSCEVYGVNYTTQLRENTPLNPLNTYAVSKVAAEQLCLTFAKREIPIVIARPFNCYGPRATHPYIVPEIIMQLSKGRTLRLGNLTARDFTYVDDTARALIALLASNVPNGDAINVGSGKTYNIESLAQMLADIMEISELEIQLDDKRVRKQDIEYFRCNNTKLRSYTDWFPQVGIEEGLRRTVLWFREHGSRWPLSSNDIKSLVHSEI